MWDEVTTRPPAKEECLIIALPYLINKWNKNRGIKLFIIYVTVHEAPRINRDLLGCFEKV